MGKKKSIKAGYVYLIHAVGTNRYKIGRTQSVPYRLKRLRNQSPFELVLIDDFKSEDFCYDEAFLHQYLAKYRVYGEWFELSGELLNFSWFYSETFAKKQRETPAPPPVICKTKLVDEGLRDWLEALGIDGSDPDFNFQLNVFLYEHFFEFKRFQKLIEEDMEEYGYWPYPTDSATLILNQINEGLIQL
jgi:hypothetical protein